MLEPELLHKTLKAALRSGGDHADIFVERRVGTSIVIEDDKVEKLITGSTAGVGVRVLFDGKTAYAITNDLTEGSLMALATTLRASVAEGRSIECADLRVRRPAFTQAVKTPPSGVPVERKVRIMMEANAMARGFDPSIRQVSITYRDSVQSVQIAASDGRLCQEERTQSVALANVVAMRDGVVQTGYEPVGGARGFELFDLEPLTKAAQRAASLAVRMLGARRAHGGRMPVVISSEAGGTMIHEAIGHGLEADLAGQGLSRFSGKIGAQVASPLVSVLDDATLDGRRGSYSFDDEGTPSGRTELVRDGVLLCYMCDLLSHFKYGYQTTGNGRRESYRSRPIPRMSNTYIAPGKSDPSEVLRSTERGLYVRKMGGGQVNTVNGDFVFDVSEGYIIEGGKMGELVRGATLSGNGPEVLMSIDMVGSDLGFAIGTCGKDGQGAPVSDAMPTLRIPDIVVGGAL